MIPSQRNNSRKKLREWIWVFPSFYFSSFIAIVDTTLVSFDTSFSVLFYGWEDKAFYKVD